MKNIFITLSLILLATQLPAQDDALLKLQKTEEMIANGELSEADMFEQYQVLIWDYRFRDSVKSNLYSQKAIAFAREKNNLVWEAKYLRRIGLIHSGKNRLDSTFYYLDKALDLLKDKGYFYEEALVYDNLGTIYGNIADYENALKSYLKALELNEMDKNEDKNADKTKNIKHETSVLINTASIYFDLFNYEKNEEYLLKAKKIVEEHEEIDFSRLKPALYGNLYEVYNTTGRREKGLPFLEKAYESAVEIGALSSIVYNSVRLSQYYKEEKALNKALDYAEEAVEIAEQTGSPYLINLAEGGLIQVYISMRKPEIALHHAELLAQRLEPDDWEELEDIYGSFVLIYAMLGDIEMTEEYLMKYRDFIANYSDETMHAALQEMQAKYDLQEKNLEITRKEAEIERQKTVRNFYIIGLIIALIIILMMIYIVRLNRKRNQELREMNATKDKFFSIISHDLKNPAIAQRNALQALVENESKWNQDIIKEYHDELLKSAEGSVELLFSLLNWAQVQTGRMPFNPTVFDLTDVVKTETKLMKNIIENKNIQLSLQMPETVLVKGDRNMLATIIRNLLTNAVKFTESGGEVSVEITQTDNNNYYVSINDTGVGMNKEQINDLFHIDRQQSKSGTDGEHGSGLGLIVCKELLEKHGSSLDIESEVGKGSKFGFVLCHLS